MAVKGEVVRTTLLARPDKNGWRSVVIFKGEVPGLPMVPGIEVGAYDGLSGIVCLTNGLNPKQKDAIVKDVEAAVASERS